MFHAHFAMAPMYCCCVRCSQRTYLCKTMNQLSAQVENFTVTFSDGRVLCYLIHHYHPSLLSEVSISHSTTQTVECSPRGRLELSGATSDSDSSFESFPTGLNGTCCVFAAVW